MNNGSAYQMRLLIICKFIVDLLCIPVIFILAYSLKFKIGWVFHRVFLVPFGKVYEDAQVEPYFSFMGLIMVLWIVAFYYSGLYRKFTGLMPLVDEYLTIIKAVSIATIEIMALSFLYKSFPGSRFVMFYAWGLGVLFLFVSRYLFYRIELALLKKGIGAVRTCMIGANEIGQDIAERLILYPSLRLFYVGTFDNKVPETLHFHLRNRFQLLGADQDFQIILDQRIKIIFLAKTTYTSEQLNTLVSFCDEQEIELRMVSDVGMSHPGRLKVLDFDGIACLTYTDQIQPSPVSMMIKRLADIIVSALGLILGSPLFLIVAVLIKIVSPNGPVLYCQERVGKDGRLFNMIKFRTMIPDAEVRTGPVMVNEGKETRYIRFGDFFRKTSIDELPQLINVLNGEMSLVGPRPERPFFVAQFNESIPHFHLRHQMLGGITGWAQVNGRSVLTRKPEHKVKYDLYYIQNWSLSLDIKIIFKTFFVVLAREEAY